MAYMWVSKVFGTLGRRSLGTGTWLTRRNTLPRHVCYSPKFGRFISNCLGEGRGPRNVGDVGAPSPWDRGATVPLETCSCLTVPNFVAL